MNPETEQKIEEARQALDSRWSEDRSRNVLAGVRQGYARRRTARIGAAVVAVAALCLAVPIAFDRLAPETVPFHDGLEVSASSGTELAEGVAIAMLEPGTRVALVELDDSILKMKMDEGRAHFDIERSGEMRYVLAAGEVEIEVVGTSFDIESRTDEVTIAVHEGTVAVRSERLNVAEFLSAGDVRTLDLSAEPAGGDEAEVSPEVTDELAAAEPVELADDEPQPRDREPNAVPNAGSKAPRAAENAGRDEPKAWRERARNKDYNAASKMILEDPRLVNRRAVGELFDAADAMRRTGHHDVAAQYLSAIATDHPADSRAAMAAHTRGRILARRLGRHCDAASSFETAQRLGLEGMLQRDSLANEAEALVKCGRLDAARARIDTYARSYPNGPHLETLQTLLEQVGVE